jgi:hypothetical protein
MSELDAYFGTKPETPMPTAQITHFARYPARIRSVCDAFMDEMCWTADPTTKRSVAAGAKRFVDVHGEDPKLLVRAIQRLKNNAPHIYDNISSPGSLITTARTLKRKPDPDSDEARQKYVTGEYADFFDDGGE